MNVERWLVQLEQAGARVLVRGSPASVVLWRQHQLRSDLHASGRSSFLVLHPDADLEPAALLARNPGLGWSWVLTDAGQVARRLVLAPQVWCHRSELAPALDELVSGINAAGETACRVPLFPLRALPEPGNSAGLARAICGLLLHYDYWAWDGGRHFQAEGASCWDAELAGLSPLRARARAEAQVIRALCQAPPVLVQVLTQSLFAGTSTPQP